MNTGDSKILHSSIPWMQTFSGKSFQLEKIDPGKIDIVDIAHGLSLTCRFNGHCRTFYSVAQHSILVSEIVSPENALWGLLHDAAEAYIGDVTRPVKRLIPQFKEVEARILKAVASKFDLPERIPEEVLDADNSILATEASQLMPDFTIWTDCPAEPIKDMEIIPWSWEKSKRLYIEKVNNLIENGRQ